MLSLLFGIWEWFTKKEERKLIIVGIDNAGKSTTLEQLKRFYTGKGMDIEKIPPTIGLNIGRFSVDGVVAICWDVGGQTGLRSLWGSYFDEVDGIVFIVDSSEPNRFKEANEAFQSVLSHPALAGKPLLFLANKRDVPDATPIDEISVIFGLDEIDSRSVRAIAVSAKNNERLDVAIRWIVREAVAFNKTKETSAVQNDGSDSAARVEMVEVTLVNARTRTHQLIEDTLPENPIALEMMQKELEISIAKLSESTITLENAARDATDESEAREYFEYALENRGILQNKRDKLQSIVERIKILKPASTAITQSPHPPSHVADGNDGQYI